MNDQLLITTIDKNGVARLTMNRPDIRNAFNEQLIGDICDAMGRLNSDPSVRVIVLTGAGKAFSAGADLNMMKRAANYSAAENKDDARRLAHMLSSIYHSPKPTIALVTGQWSLPPSPLSLGVRPISETTATTVSSSSVPPVGPVVSRSSCSSAPS